MSLIIIAPYFGSVTCFLWPQCSETLASGYSASVASGRNIGAEAGLIQTGPEPGYSLWLCASPPYLWQFRQFKSDIWWVLINGTKIHAAPKATQTQTQTYTSVSVFCHLSVHPPIQASFVSPQKIIWFTLLIAAVMFIQYLRPTPRQPSSIKEFSCFYHTGHLHSSQFPSLETDETCLQH